MNAYERHKQLMLDWQKYYGGRLPQLQQTAAKSDRDSLREAYRFIRSAEDDADDSWEARLARRYYAKLFREYAIADLSRHKVRQALLWCSALWQQVQPYCLDQRVQGRSACPARHTMHELSAQEGRVGMRWRTEAEVTAGTGQFSCGARKCGERRGLASFEAPFAYTEAGLDKQALVKARPACAACTGHLLETLCRL